MHKLLICLLPLFCFACAGEDANAIDENTTITSPPELITSDDVKSQLAPPPPACQLLPEADVFSVLGGEVRIPLPGTRSTGIYSSCRYDLDGPGWVANLEIELSEESGERQTMIDEIAGAKGEQLANVNGSKARFMNDGRIIVVENDRKPYRVKFSARPFRSSTIPFDAEAQRATIIKLAEVVHRNLAVN